MRYPYNPKFRLRKSPIQPCWHVGQPWYNPAVTCEPDLEDCFRADDHTLDPELEVTGIGEQMCLICFGSDYEKMYRYFISKTIDRRRPKKKEPEESKKPLETLLTVREKFRTQISDLEKHLRSEDLSDEEIEKEKDRFERIWEARMRRGE